MAYVEAPRYGMLRARFADVRKELRFEVYGFKRVEQAADINFITREISSNCMCVNGISHPDLSLYNSQVA